MFKTWRQWLALGTKDRKKGLFPRYPDNIDYMLGYAQYKPGK